MATDPAFDGLVVKMISTNGNSQAMTRELVKLVLGEPDAKIFNIPKGREITVKHGRAYYCDVKPGMPVSSHPVK